VKVLDDLIELAMVQQQVDTSEPFLARSERYGHLDPKRAIGDWVACSLLEELEKNSTYSSFYTPQESPKRLTAFRDLGFGSEEMVRRLALVEQRTAAPPVG